MTQQHAEGMLSPYRVLDLTDEKGLLCGKLLGDLGADVIKIEKPSGDPARSIGPFYHNEADPEKSLSWFAFNTSKRGITLDIEKTDGQEIFKKLVKTADFVIESFTPGYMDNLSLGYSDLEKLNPGVIMVSITPFGQTGPYKDYKAPDIVAWAMGGEMYVSGNTDRPPVRVSYNSQAYLHAGTEAAVGAMAALYHRTMTGEGQQVDISVQECVTRVSHQSTTIPWDTNKVLPRRGLWLFPNAPIKRWLWPCRNGHVVFGVSSGLFAERNNMPLIEWMKSEGVTVDFLEGFDWSNFSSETVNQEMAERFEKTIIEFFMAHTKAELLDGAVKLRIMLYPVTTTADIFKSTQLKAREYWVKLEHSELSDTITYPGAFAKASETPIRITCRAPLIGEHNQEVYEKELGFSSDKLIVLKQANII